MNVRLHMRSIHSVDNYYKYLSLDCKQLWSVSSAALLDLALLCKNRQVETTWANLNGALSFRWEGINKNSHKYDFLNCTGL